VSLVYLITGLPRLRRGESAPISRPEFVRRCRDILTGRDREEFELLVREESVEETVRLTLKGELEGLNEQERLASILRDRTDGVPADQLPSWLRRPGLLRQLLRRHYFEVTRQARTQFLLRWAHFRVDIGELVTALLCRSEGMSRDAFLVQMEGSFDASAPVIIRRWQDPDLGIGTRFPWVPRVIAAVQMEDLQAMSRELDNVMWAKIEELSTHDLFTIETLLAYYLQLRIVGREASWNAERGQQVLDRILSLSSQATEAPIGAPTSAPSAEATRA
jgi:hypothetical protein